MTEHVSFDDKFAVYSAVICRTAEYDCCNFFFTSSSIDNLLFLLFNSFSNRTFIGKWWYFCSNRFNFVGISSCWGYFLFQPCRKFFRIRLEDFKSRSVPETHKKKKKKKKKNKRLSKYFMITMMALNIRGKKKQKRPPFPYFCMYTL